MTINQVFHQDHDRHASSEFIEHSSKKKRSKYLYLLLGIGGAGLILLLARPMLLTLPSNNSPTETPARVLPVETIKVEQVDSNQVSRTYTGEIAAIRTSNLGFSRGG